MKRETRINLIFLSIFLAVSLPGAVILFKKKLDPRASNMGAPDAVRRRIPYMTPMAASSEVKRYVPPLTGEWVSQLATEHGGGEVLLRDGLPVMSDDFLVQWTTLRDNGNVATVGLILWDHRAGEGETYSVSTREGGGKVTQMKKIPLPEPVRRELLSGGFPRPPREVTWINSELPKLSEPARLEVRYSVGQTAVTTSVNLFTR